MPLPRQPDYARMFGARRSVAVDGFQPWLARLASEEVAASLKAGKSGIEAAPDMTEHGFRSQVAGTVKLNVADHVDKRTLRFMGPGAAVWWSVDLCHAGGT